VNGEDSGASPHTFEQEVVGHLADIVSTLEGVGVELATLVLIARAAAAEKLEGGDPVRGTIYDLEDDLRIPPWANRDDDNEGR